MKTIASLLLAFVVAFGAPGALAQEASPTAEAIAPPQPEAAVQPQVEPTVQPQVEENAQSPQERLLSQRTDQAIYKGVVGNLLEAVPMDPDQRVGLQRANAIVGSPFSVRSIALLVGISNPIVMIGGLIWGFWAASQIEKPAAPAPVAARAEVTAAVTTD